MSRNLTDALSKLFIKLGGKTSDSKENKGPVDYIDDITDIVEPGGGGGGNISPYFIVSFSYNESTEKYEADKTFAEVKEAYDNGSLIIFTLEDTADIGIAKLSGDTFECQIYEISNNEKYIDIYNFFFEYSSENCSVDEYSSHIDIN